MGKRELPSPALLRKLLSYDPETGALTWLPRPIEMFPSALAHAAWTAKNAGKPAFTSFDGQGYYQGSIFSRTIKAHRVIWAIHFGEWAVTNISHVNRVRSDNRIVNLRSVPAPVKRPIRVEGDVAYVPLTHGYEAVIDAADVPLVEPFGWCASVEGTNVYAVRKQHSGGKCRHVSLHRFILKAPSGLQVDHINGDGLNNRRCNLRLVTNAQNQQNRGKSKRNTSGFKGVNFFKRTGKWRAGIRANGKVTHLGYFATAEEASAAYVEAAARLHGEFRRKE